MLNNKKTVVFAASDDSHFYLPLKRSFGKKGFKVVYFNYRKNSLVEKFVFGLSLLFPIFKNVVIELRNKRLVNIARKNKANLLFVSKGELISQKTIESLKKLNIVTINWFSDLFPYFPNLISTLSEYDIVFTPDQDDIDNYQNKMKTKLFKLSYGAPIINESPDFKNRKYNVVFIGAFSKDREEMIHLLREFNPLVWGNKKWAASKVSQYYQNKWLSPTNVLEILQNTKIAINVHQVELNEGTTLNVRAFESTGSGALLLTDFRRDLPSLFKISGDKQEVVCYKNFDELKEYVRYYLTHEEDRLEIAKRGFERAKKDHTYDKRVSTILSKINF